MSLSFYSMDFEPDWGAGLQSPDSRYKRGVQVAIKQTISVPSTTGEYVLVAQHEVGTVTREGSGRILVRLDRRSVARSVYLPTQMIEVTT